MKQPRKYGPGEPIASLDELIAMSREARAAERDAFVWEANGYGKQAGRVVHVDWIGNTSAFRLTHMINGGAICRAVITDEYRAWLAAETEAAG
jgi:hypothetical protein